MYKLLKIGTQANIQVREYVVDEVSDIASLPSSDPFGSTALVIATGEKYVKNSSGTYVKQQTSGGGSGTYAPLEVVGEMTGGEGGIPATLTINKTAVELWAAAEAGRSIKCIVSTVDEDDNTVTVTGIMPIEIYRVELGAQNLTAYSIKIRPAVDSEDTIYFCDFVTENQEVVFTEITKDGE